jgi:hypothetical protein
LSHELLTRAGAAQRTGVVGLTRSGKTTLVQALIADVESCVVIDTVHADADWLPFARHFGYVVTSDVADVRRHAKVLFRADIVAIEDHGGWGRPDRPGWQWTELLRAIAWRGNTVTVFDEAMDQLSTRGIHPDARRMVTSGAARGLPTIWGSQAPLFVDTRLMANTEHFFAFGTVNQDYLDVIRARRDVDPEPLRELGPHEFAYHALHAPAWETFAPLPWPPVWLKKRTTRAEPNADDARDELHAARLTEESTPASAG